ASTACTYTLSLHDALPILRGADQVQQIVITGHYANGGVRDLSRKVAFRALDGRVVRVQAGGLAAAQKNGATEVIAEFQGQSVKRSEEHTSELQSLRHLVCR